MRVPLTARWGIGLALITALISGVAVYLNGLWVKDFPDPILLAAVRNSLVGVSLAVILLAGLGRSDGRVCVSDRLRGPGQLPSGRRSFGLVLLGVIGGGIPFALFFTGLSIASTPGSAIIQKTLFVWVAILAVPLLRERLGMAQVSALVVLVAGTLVLGQPRGLAIGPGEILILAATLLWAAEVILARRMLAGPTAAGAVGTLTAATARMAIGGLVLFGIVAFTGDLAGVAAFSIRQWAEIAVTALLLAGYVTTWYAALKRAPAAAVASVLVLGAVVTSALQAATAGTLPRTSDLAGLALVVAGTFLAIAAARSFGRAGSVTVAPSGSIGAAQEARNG